MEKKDNLLIYFIATPCCYIEGGLINYDEIFWNSNSERFVYLYFKIFKNPMQHPDLSTPHSLYVHTELPAKPH